MLCVAAVFQTNGNAAIDIGPGHYPFKPALEVGEIVMGLAPAFGIATQPTQAISAIE